MEKEEEQGEQEPGHSIQTERRLLQPQEVQQLLCDGQHPGGETHRMGVSEGGNHPPAVGVPYTR